MSIYDSLKEQAPSYLVSDDKIIKDNNRRFVYEMKTSRHYFIPLSGKKPLRKFDINKSKFQSYDDVDKILGNYDSYGIRTGYNQYLKTNLLVFDIDDDCEKLSKTMRLSKPTTTKKVKKLLQNGYLQVDKKNKYRPVYFINSVFIDELLTYATTNYNIKHVEYTLKNTSTYKGLLVLKAIGDKKVTQKMVKSLTGLALETIQGLKSTLLENEYIMYGEGLLKRVI